MGEGMMVMSWSVLLTGILPLLSRVTTLFFVWANIHEEFLLGFGLFFVWAVFYIGQKCILAFQFHPRPLLSWKREQKVKQKVTTEQKLLDSIQSERKEILQVISILLLSLIVTVINPFGIGVHLDALSHFGNPLLKDINEYLPLASFSQEWWKQVIIALFLAFSVLFLYFEKKLTPKISFLGVAIFVYILSIGVSRYAWPAYYLSVPLLKPLSSFFKRGGGKTIVISETTFLCMLLAITIVIKQPFSQFFRYSWDDYCSTFIQCSRPSVEFLESHHLTANLFSFYGWGGWLIWNYPMIKPTIDGRMHLWRDEHGYSGFADSYGYQNNFKDIDASLYNVVYMSPDQPVYKHMFTLVNEGRWEMAYQDERAGIFVRSNTPEGWKKFANTNMNLSLVYPQNFKIIQISPQLAALLEDPAHPDNKHAFLIYVSQVAANSSYIQAAVPFSFPDQLTQSKPVQFPGFDSVMNTYSDANSRVQLLFMKQGERLIMICFPENQTQPPEVVNKMLESIRILH